MIIIDVKGLPSTASREAITTLEDTLRATAVGILRLASLDESEVHVTVLFPAHQLPLDAERDKKNALSLSEKEQEALARNPATPPEILFQLARSPQRVILKLVVQNPATPAAVLGALAEQGFARALSHPRTPLAILLHCMTSDGWQDRAAIAKNPAATLEILLALAADKSPMVRRHVANRKDLPAEVMAKLRDDPHLYVQRALAKRARS